MDFSHYITGIGPDSSLENLIAETLRLEVAEWIVLKTKSNTASYRIEIMSKKHTEKNPPQFGQTTIGQVSETCNQ